MSNKKFKWVVLVTLLPILLWPYLITQVQHFKTGTDRFLMMGMPVFALVAGYLANYAYKERPEVGWILVVVTWLSYAAFGFWVFAY